MMQIQLYCKETAHERSDTVTDSDMDQTPALHVTG